MNFFYRQRASGTVPALCACSVFIGGRALARRRPRAGRPRHYDFALQTLCSHHLNFHGSIDDNAQRRDSALALDHLVLETGEQRHEISTLRLRNLEFD